MQTSTMNKYFISLILLFVISIPCHADIICIKEDGALAVRTKATINNLKQHGAIGPVGDKGATGIGGAAGAAGSASVLGRATVFSAASYDFSSHSELDKDELCPAGKVTLGGGCISDYPAVVVVNTYPFDSSPQTAWRCHFRNYTNSPAIGVTVTSLAICGFPN